MMNVLETTRVSTRLWAWVLIMLQLSTHSLAALQHVEAARFEMLGEKRVVEKRSVHDLLDMDHPEFMGEHWMDTFRNHVGEIHKRGHKLQLRNEPVDMEDVMEAFEGSNSKFSVDDEVERLSKLPTPQNVTYKQVPVDPKEILTGVIVGIGGVLIPGLRDANNGSEAMATFQQCFDPRKLSETFVIKDFFKVQTEMPSISESDMEEFAQSTMDDGGSASELLGRFRNLKAKSWKTWKYLAAILKKMGPYLLKVVKHAQTCGVLDIVLGFVLGFILPFFPPMLLLLVAVAAMAFELFTQIKAAVDNWYKNWFKFGKAVGAIVGFLVTLIVSYLMSRSKTVECSGKGKGCTYEMPKNEMEGWQPPKAQEHCGGKYCNPVYRRDDIIDPNLIDDVGRTNVERMKAGRAAIGPDGLPINLHHIHQTPDGPIAELTDTFHSVNHKELHQFLKAGEPSRIDRSAFGTWRSSYWRARGREMEKAIAAGTHSYDAAGKAVQNYGPLAATAVVKSFDSFQESLPSVGEFIEQVLDSITDGDPNSQVTSIKEGLPKLDVVRLILKAIKGEAKDAADETDKQDSPVSMHELKNLTPDALRVANLQKCSLDAQCAETLSLEAHSFERADGVVDNGIGKVYTTHFAPDTGYALLVSTIVSEGQTKVEITRDAAEPKLAGHINRRALKWLTEAQYLEEFEEARQEVTLQHCDGYGTYKIAITGQRPPPAEDAFASEDPKFQAYWKANGGPPDPTMSFYNIGAQYVPYPTVPSSATFSHVESIDEHEVLEVPSATANVEKYHVFVAPHNAPAIATTCDLMRQGVSVATANATDSAYVRVEVPKSKANGRVYVVAESEGGAYTMYKAANAGAEDSYSIPFGGGFNAGIIAAIAVSLFVVLCCFALCIVYYLKKAGKISTRLPAYNSHSKKIVLQ